MITCNIGDMLMRWSDDQLLSNLHRVRMPSPDEYQGARYSIAFFAQANTDAIIQGPKKLYEPISAQGLPAAAHRCEFLEEDPDTETRRAQPARRQRGAP